MKQIALWLILITLCCGIVYVLLPWTVLFEVNYALTCLDDIIINYWVLALWNPILWLLFFWLLPVCSPPCWPIAHPISTQQTGSAPTAMSPVPPALPPPHPLALPVAPPALWLPKQHASATTAGFKTTQWLPPANSWVATTHAGHATTLSPTVFPVKAPISECWFLPATPALASTSTTTLVLDCAPAVITPVVSAPRVIQYLSALSAIRTRSAPFQAAGATAIPSTMTTECMSVPPAATSVPPALLLQATVQLVGLTVDPLPPVPAHKASGTMARLKPAYPAITRAKPAPTEQPVSPAMPQSSAIWPVWAPSAPASTATTTTEVPSNVHPVTPDAWPVSLHPPAWPATKLHSGLTTQIQTSATAEWVTTRLQPQPSYVPGAIQDATHAQEPQPTAHPAMPAWTEF